MRSGRLKQLYIRNMIVCTSRKNVNHVEILLSQQSCATQLIMLIILKLAKQNVQTLFLEILKDLPLFTRKLGLVSLPKDKYIMRL